MLKKFAVFLLIAFSVLTIAFDIFTATKDDTLELTNIENVTVTDKKEIEKLAREQGLKIPKNYKFIEKIEKGVYTEDDITEDDESGNETDFQGILYSIKNVRVLKSEFYNLNDYDINLYEGPMDISETFTKTAPVQKNIKVRIGYGTVNKALGYEISKTYTLSKAFTSSVAGEMAVVKTCVLYRRTVFDIYNKRTGECVQKNAFVDKPVGIYVSSVEYYN